MAERKDIVASFSPGLRCWCSSLTLKSGKILMGRGETKEKALLDLQRIIREEIRAISPPDDGD